MELIIEASEVYKNFHLGDLEIEILKDINLDIGRGEFVSLMGPSGSGKSTLLYLLGGLDKPTSGTIKVKGRELSSMTDKEASRFRRQEMGFIFQFYNLVPNLNIEDNIMLPVLLDGKRMSNYRKRIDEILDIVSLSARKSHTPRELSGGEQQRVAIARALMNDPDIILADEPVGNLDSKTGTDIMELFKQINLEKHKTILQVTHSEEMAKYSNRIIRLRDGKVWE
ncbi:abc transporter, atp-binding protein [hydrocarbon metagenome]|uniref:Abc transporter, atp-binding protein n=1 Tax=hydrocarbon metagenome TaxID=938273 RepID=A0A0W8E9F9_9ZZZZ